MRACRSAQLSRFTLWCCFFVDSARAANRNVGLFPNKTFVSFVFFVVKYFGI